MPSHHDSRGSEPAEHRMRDNASEAVRRGALQIRGSRTRPMKRCGRPCRSAMNGAPSRINGAATIIRRRCCAIWAVKSSWSRVPKGDATATHSETMPLTNAIGCHPDNRLGRAFRSWYHPRKWTSATAISTRVIKIGECRPLCTSDGMRLRGVFRSQRRERRHGPVPVRLGAASRGTPPVRWSPRGSGSSHKPACCRRPGSPGGRVDPR